MNIHLLEKDPRALNDPTFRFNMGSFSKIIFNINEELKKLNLYAGNQSADWVGYASGLDFDFGPFKNRFLIHVFETTVLPDYFLNFRRNSKNYKIFGLSQQISDLWDKYGFETTKTVDIGVDVNFWQKMEDIPKFDVFTIGSVTSCNFRSGIFHTINSFIKLAENSKKDYQLIIKDTDDRNRILPVWVDSLRKMGYKISYICSRWDDFQIREFYNKCHVLAYNPSHTSAGLPILEAAACELPCIVGDFSPTNIYPSSAKIKVNRRMSISECKGFFCNELGLPYTFPEGWIDEGMADVHLLSEDSMVSLFKDIKDNYKKYQKIAKESRKECIEKWTWKHSTDQLIKALND